MHAEELSSIVEQAKLHRHFWMRMLKGPIAAQMLAEEDVDFMAMMLATESAAARYLVDSVWAQHNQVSAEDP
jgi:hypothetical protein